MIRKGKIEKYVGKNTGVQDCEEDKERLHLLHFK